MSEEESTDQRLTSLERFAEAVTVRQDDEDQLKQGVSRLTNETSALNTILNKVDEQQQKLRDLDKDKANKTDLVDVEERGKFARSQNLAKTYRLLAGALVISIMGIIGGAQLTDFHFQQCILNGPDNSAERGFCNTIFPGHDHPQDRSLEALLKASAARQVKSIEDARLGCERTRERAEIEIARERELSRVDFEPARPAHAKAAESLEATLVNCDEAFPLPEERLSR